MSAERPRVVVIGLGRMGGSLAAALAAREVDVLAIDRRPDVVQTFSETLPNVVVADATDPEALSQLELDGYERAVVAIGEALEASVLATSILADLGVQEIWAKASSEQHARILKRMGAQHVILPEHEAGARLAHLVTGHMLDFLSVDEDFAFIKTRVPKTLAGHVLGEAGVRSRYGVTVVAIKHAGGQFSYATAETRLGPDDVIVVSGASRDVTRFADLT
ncbi:TrkA family potassium uptake protein [Intrasporangium calvum]|uniref:TrkA family potassium uptake protein n=1 Tax=Intrasporangium calvum TaxID=53358 RepID=A0ABT5GDP1_9MICO|nr:TrkA family potassium uptake protein [Intrasporangium calvum]MDC5696273.1 TrkA family potassium uptake protein [Intrasporangium calvum]